MAIASGVVRLGCCGDYPARRGAIQRRLPKGAEGQHATRREQGMSTHTEGREDLVTEGEPQLAIEVDDTGRSTHIRLRGDLDLETSAYVWRELDGLTATAEVTVDVSDLAFVDSSGLGCLFKLHRRATDAGGIVVVRGASPALRRVMETAGLHRLLAILPDSPE
jgi:stage II sporulation protein AA (anti-sigma F factor antagonist)